jgi:hypothetical protein
MKMPWSVKRNYKGCKGYAVVKDSNGEVVGCHSSREDAINHQRALYASEPEAKMWGGVFVEKRED